MELQGPSVGASPRSSGRRSLSHVLKWAEVHENAGPSLGPQALLVGHLLCGQVPVLAPGQCVSARYLAGCCWLGPARCLVLGRAAWADGAGGRLRAAGAASPVCPEWGGSCPAWVLGPCARRCNHLGWRLFFAIRGGEGAHAYPGPGLLCLQWEPRGPSLLLY